MPPRSPSRCKAAAAHATRLPLFALALGASACGSPDAARDFLTPADLVVSVRADSLSAPDTIAPGWTRLRVQEHDGRHIVVLYRLTDGAEAVDVPAFANSLDGAATPRGAVALGGPEVGDSGEVIVELTAGRYVLGCVMRGEDGHRHAAAGEARLVVVRDEPEQVAADNPAPQPTQEVRMGDFAYAGPDSWSAGQQLLAVRNVGVQDHQLRLARLRPGATLSDWMDAEEPGEVATDLVGVARLGAGQTAYLPVDLSEGEYVLYCLVPDPGSGQPHVMLGMFRKVTVGEREAVP